MYEELYQYLIHYKKLIVPGIGSFLLDRKPAVVDFPNRIIHPPFYQVSFQSQEQAPAKFFFSWLGSALKIPEREAVLRFNEFVALIKQQISGGDIIHWNGVGELSKGSAGDIAFIPDTIIPEKPVKAGKLTRGKADQMIRVGEDDRGSEEMTTLLNQPADKRSLWWVTAAILTILSIMFIGWYFSEHGVNINSTENTRSITPAISDSTYKILP